MVHVAPGKKVLFSILGDPDSRFEATLRSIEPAPASIATDDDSTTTSSSDEAIYYNALFDVPNPDGLLRISMTAEVTIVLDEAVDVLLIPESGLGEKVGQGTCAVNVLTRDGRVETRTVKVGLSDSVHIEIREGLAEGEEVILGQADAGSAVNSSSLRRPPMRI